MADEYSNGVAKSKLKLKVDGDSSKKKKKKSKKSLDMSMVNGGVKKRDERGGQKHELLARISTNVEPNNSMESTQETTSATTTRRFTKAELAFKQQQQAMRNKRILEMASTTHKQRVEKFNEHLDTLTEHFDIPKVSWTK